ncbi:MAG TPA: DUF6268 family outer membrane beta-barrel protein [Candidatus Acidoferrum sp.]|jgi:hypothetical protein|nr:DUF6268 family outer membrane beta-barrel protein [Candidatus Acidoferrum sp.]
MNHETKRSAQKTNCNRANKTKSPEKRQEYMNKRKPIRCVSILKMRQIISNYLLLGSIVAIPSVSASAQENRLATASTDLEKSSQPGETSWETESDVGYVGGSSAKFQGKQLGNSDAYNVAISAGTRITLNNDWFLKFGLGSDNYFLGSVAGEPIPDAIHTLHLNTGVGYHWNDQWTFTALLNQSLLRLDDVNGNDIGVSGGLVAEFKQSPSLTWIFGITGSQYGDVPVLPILGVHWQINEHYTLEVGIPKTRLSYNFDSNLNVYGGLDLVGTTFRTENDLGTKTGLPQYNNAVATYRDIRLGVGVSYRFWRGIRAEAETGCSVYRQINYQDINQSIDFNPSPYVRVGLSVRF